METVQQPQTPGSSRQKIEHSEEQWRSRLTPLQFRVLRQKATELPFSGVLTWNHEAGSYCCAGCGEVLFLSNGKFDSGCGWPSFFRPANPASISEQDDTSLGMFRIEVTCSKCGGHLGHLFPDGPMPTGMRYCINSAAMTFEPLRQVG
jgi:peptide-methionine (R)-S-oxide reductase